VPQKRHTKVLRLRILKPAGEMSWKELGALLRDARYRVYRLANLAVSEAYLNFHLWRTGRADEFQRDTIGRLSRRLREMLREEDVAEEELERFSKTGATPASVHDALSKYKIGAITAPSKWREVVRGRASLPTFRTDMAIPIRCDKGAQRRLERTPDGDVELDLMICVRPYPRVVIQTGNIGDGARAILDRLLENESQSAGGYRQRCLEIKQDARSAKWWLYITYDFPAGGRPALDPSIVVGADLGVACPLYAAISNGHARLGYNQFRPLAARIRSLQTQIMARRRSMLGAGKSALSQRTARSGHGRKRKLHSIEQLSGRINDAYTTLNHQLSTAVVEFAQNHGAGIIQIENLEGLRDKLTGTFLGERWRYRQLQNFISYKADEAGIELRQVEARYTSQRCSKCGHINTYFTREYRDANRTDRWGPKFRCEECDFEADPDYNAARNLTVLDIHKVIVLQCQRQGIDHPALSQSNQ